MEPLTDRPALAGALAAGAAALGVELDPQRRELMLEYLALLRHWNRSFNLTAVHEPAQMVPRHLLDSLSLLPWLRGTRVLDVGSGAGLPGLVLAVARPKLEVTLLDPALKRTRFLAHAAQTLGLPGVRVVRSRLQDLPPGEVYDSVLARASLALETLLDKTPALLAAGGRLLAMQGRAAALPLAPAGWRLRRVRLEVPGLEAQRHLVIGEREA